MQTVHDPRSIFTLWEKIMTSKTKRGKYLPLPTLYPKIFLTERDIDMGIRVHWNFFLPYQLIRATESCLLTWASKISKLFPKMLMSRALTRGLKLLKIGIFHENQLFSVKIFLYSTTSMLCHISLERSANTEKNGI